MDFMSTILKDTETFSQIHKYTNLHNSIEEASVPKVIYAFDRE